LCARAAEARGTAHSTQPAVGNERQEQCINVHRVCRRRADKQQASSSPSIASALQCLESRCGLGGAAGAAAANSTASSVEALPTELSASSPTALLGGANA